MSEDERTALVDYVAANPEAGISLGGGGKSGGYRTIYVFGGRHMPIYLVTVFAKNEKDNLSKAEQAAAVQLSKMLVASYGEDR